MPDQDDTNAGLRAIYERRGFVLGAEAPHALRYAALLIDRPAKPPRFLAGATGPSASLPDSIYLTRFDVTVRDLGITIAVFAEREHPPKLDDVVTAWREFAFPQDDLRKALVEAAHEGRNALVLVEHHLRKDNLARKNEGQDHE